MRETPILQRCDDPENDQHQFCIDAERLDCECGCVGYLNCATCGELVFLVADDPEDPSYSHGECCTWGYVDYFDGTIRLDLSHAFNDSPEPPA